MNTDSIPGINRPVAAGLVATGECFKCGYQVFTLGLNAVAHESHTSYRQWDALICQQCGYTEFYDAPDPGLMHPGRMSAEHEAIWSRRFFLLDRRVKQGPYR